MKLLEAWLTQRTGNPGLSVVRGTLAPLPYPGNNSGLAGYGWVGGQTTGNHPVLVSVQDPVAGDYTLLIRANADGSSLADATATLNLRVVAEIPVLNPVSGADQAVVSEQIAESWRYFQLDIPADTRLKGIRVSLKNVSSGVPRMVIRRGTAMPKDFATSPSLSSDAASWPDGAQWAQANDFTNLQSDSSGTIAAGRYFLAAYDAPMGAGSYIIGVTKDSSVNTVSQPNTPAMSYTIVAEAIGEGLDLPVTRLNFDNTAAPEVITALPEREMRFYQVTVPAGASSWRIHLQESATSDTPAKVRDGAVTIRKGRIPAFDSAKDPNAKGGATMRQINLGDHWALLPNTADGALEGGDYFIAVTSLGTGPTSNKTGADPSHLMLFSKGELAVMPFPALTASAPETMPFTLGPAEISAYDFSIPAVGAGEPAYGLVLNVTRTLGASNFSLMKLPDHGRGMPVPPGSGNDGFFGGAASFAASSDDIAGRVFAEIAPGNYRVIVRSSQKNGTYGNATGWLSAQLQRSSDIPELPFDGGTLSVTNAGATTDLLQYRVEIPDDPNWHGWGVRIDGPVSGKPAIIVRRGLPVEPTSPGQVNSELIDWPIGHTWAQTDDFTKLKNDPGVPSGHPERDRSQQYFFAARERPLQPGTYFIGIDNRGTTTISPRTFTLRTFALGPGYSLPLTPLTSPGAQAGFEISTPRMPAMFRITIPPLTRAWAVSVSPTLGDVTLRARMGGVPDPVSDTVYPDLKGGVHVQKSGDERFTLLPRPGTTYLPEGDCYLAAVSEGQNASIANSVIGTDAVAGFIRNEGPIPVIDLGSVGEAGVAQPLTLAAAEVKCFQVDVPAGINNLEFRLKDRSGEASLAVLRGTQIPAPGLSESYGVFGGETAGPPGKDRSIVNLGNPPPGIYTIAVRAAGTMPSSYTPAAATLAINVIKPAPLNFSETQNTGNGLSHTDARTLSDKEKYSYRVAVPSTIQGQEVLGWLVTLEQGNPTVRIYKSELDFGKAAPVTMVGRSALLVPPFLTTDTNWFIEVEGVGTTDYVIRSQPVQLTAPPWSLPTAFNRLAGDTNPGAPDGQGIRRELPQDAWEFFALDVPEGNLGLLRIALEQYGGNTNVYLRRGGIPTNDHSSAGSSGSKMFQYKMIAETSETANLSELSDTAKPASQLIPGRWFIGVKSEPLGSLRTNSGYRLKAHSGVVTDLDLNSPAPLTNQNLAEKDWRYYRFTIPRDGIPSEWRPFFTRISGSSLAYLRDTIPPFSYTLASTTSPTATPTFVDWSSDKKNNVPAAAYVKALTPGTTTLTSPPLRPGGTYFLGIYGNTSGGSVEVGSAASNQSVAIDADLAYNQGGTTLQVAAGTSKLVRIATSADATRLKVECRQSGTGLALKLEQGAPPSTATGNSAHRQNASPYAATYLFNEPLGSNWPFVAGPDYYLRLTNTTTTNIETTLRMLGSSITTEDEDTDELPDAWEITYFGSLSQTSAGDFDGDGSTNLQEYENDTHPADASSVLYLLDVRTPGGGGVVSPILAAYPSGTNLSLEARPAPGDAFRQWKSSLSSLNGSTSATAAFSITANVQATAVFQTSVARGLDAAPYLSFTDFGSGSWFGQYETSHDGTDSATSPSVGPNQQSRINTIVPGPGSLSFWWKVSSRANSGRLTLLIDHVAQSTPAPISGTSSDWARVAVDIPAGSHTISWRYARDSSSLTDGENRGYVDELSFSGPNAGFLFSHWIESRFTSAERADPKIAGPQADPDLDGLPNLIEAAVGSLPKSRDACALAIADTSQAGDLRQVRLNVRHAATPPDDLSLRLEAASSLDGSDGGWIPIAQKSGAGPWLLLSGQLAGPVESASVDGSIPTRFTETHSTPHAPRFYRLVATQNQSQP